ncbi:MAG: DUF2231 domain-containing protein [Allomuricauda sp.]
MQFGNLHPIVVHLPIGILVLAFLMELYYLRHPSKKDNGIIFFVLAIGALSALLSASTGWFLGENGGYDETLLSWHRWMAIAFSLGCVFLFFLKRSKNPKVQKTFFPVFALVLILMMVTGHYGGSLTHGEDFLFQTKYEEPIIENVDEAEVFADIVQPILQKKCVSCHNKGKTKGGLLLGSPQELLAGGDSGSLLDSLENAAPLLLHRIGLPLEEKEHMPPKGKVQLSPEEITLLEWWMENNHCFDCITKELPANDRVAAVLHSLEKDTSLRAQIAGKVGDVSLEDVASLNQKGLSVQRISEEFPLLLVNFSQRKDLTRKDFEQLKPYAQNVVEMNLAYTNFNDTLAQQLKSFKHLTKLQLQQTQITDASAKVLKEMEYLESLNLFGTELDNAALKSLAMLPNLKQLYVWQTQMTGEELLAFQQTNKDLMVQGQVADSVFAASNLGVPTIITDGEIFKDSLRVSLEQYIDGADIYYVLNDYKNDTVPKLYTGPFYIKETSRLEAYVSMQGWEPSPLSTADFLKSQVEIRSISLADAPHPKYGGKGGLTLMDQKRGTTNFVDGNWLGYEARHCTATIEFKEKSTISKVSVGSLSIPNNWIFFPTGYTVWGSVDGTTYKKLKTIKLPKPQPPKDPIEREVYNINFDPVEVKKVKLLVESTLKNPDWHAVPGGNSFIFLDEVVFN